MDANAAEAERAARFEQALGGKTLTSLARDIGVAVSTASGYAKGKVPPGDVAVLISDALGVDLAWYLTGRGSSGSGVVWLPRAAGEEGAAVPFSAEALEAAGAEPDRAWVMTVKGAAMAPTVPSGSEVVVTPHSGEPEDGLVYAVVVRGRTVVRRVQVSLKDGLLATCDNPAFGDEPLDVVLGGQLVGRACLVSSRL